MAFQVTTVFHNGYRCSCCLYQFKSSRWFDSRQEALERVTVVPPEESDGEDGVYSVEITDGSTGDKIAWASQSWPTGYGKYSGYKYTQWSGYHPDVGGFERITNRDGEVIQDKSWESLLAEMNEAYLAQELRDLKQIEIATQTALAKLGRFESDSSD